MSPTGNNYEAELRQEYRKDEQCLWLEDLVGQLSGCRVAKCRELQYWNHPELQPHLRVEGYSCCYQFVDRAGYPQYAMIARSRTAELLSSEQIVNELSSQEVVFPFEKFGDYDRQRERRRGLGKYATIRFGTRWYMISTCGAFKPYFRLVAKEPKIPNNPLTFQEFTDQLNASRAKAE
jgi:hypothetical protein